MPDDLSSNLDLAAARLSTPEEVRLAELVKAEGVPVGFNPETDTYSRFRVGGDPDPCDGIAFYKGGELTGLLMPAKILRGPLFHVIPVLDADGKRVGETLRPFGRTKPDEPEADTPHVVG